MPIPKAEQARLAAGTTRPELMAVGDSLFNGVRSLSIDARRAAWSPPAQVARALGVPFVVPDYPRPVMFDIDAIARSGQISGLGPSLLANARMWAADGRWSKTRFFDNVAVAGAEIRTLFKDTAGQARALMPGLVAKLDRVAGSPLASLSTFATAAIDLWFAINTAFLLNPSGDEALEAATQIDLVAFRKPRRLLVSIGSNEGIFSAGFLGEYDGKSVQAIPDLMDELCDQMLTSIAPGSVERIVFTNLVKLSTVPNLMPWSDGEAVGPTGYFPLYAARLTGGPGFNAQKMKAIDDEIDRINKVVAARVRTRLGSRFDVAFADTWEVSRRHDGKHDRESRPDRVFVGPNGGPPRLRNVPFLTHPFGGGFQSGGLYGLDNMHPTSVGYALVAREIVRVLGEAPPARISLREAYLADDLLQRPPATLAVTGLLISMFVSFARLLSGQRR